MTQVRSFLGLTGYPRKFVKGYETIGKPFFKMLQNGGFEWNKEAVEEFKKLKMINEYHNGASFT